MSTSALVGGMSMPSCASGARTVLNIALIEENGITLPGARPAPGPPPNPPPPPRPPGPLAPPIGRQLRIESGRGRRDIRRQRAARDRGQLCTHRGHFLVGGVAVLHALPGGHRQFVLCPQRRHHRRALADARIVVHDEGLRVRGAVHQQLDGVRARQRERPVRRRRDLARRGVHLVIDVGVVARRIVITQIPIDAIRPDVRRERALRRGHQPIIGIRRPLVHRRRRARDRPHQLIRRVEDLQLDLAGRLLAQVVVEERSERRVRRVRHLGVHRLIPIRVHPRADSVARFEQIRRRRRDLLRLRRDVAQRTHVVEHPESAAVRADHQIVHVIVGMKHHVADRRARQIEPQRLPVIAVVE